MAQQHGPGDDRSSTPPQRRTPDATFKRHGPEPPENDSGPSPGGDEVAPSPDPSRIRNVTPDEAVD